MCKPINSTQIARRPPLKEMQGNQKAGAPRLPVEAPGTPSIPTFLLLLTHFTATIGHCFTSTQAFISLFFKGKVANRRENDTQIDVITECYAKNLK
jgi:hypothetical protein